VSSGAARRSRSPRLRRARAVVVNWRDGRPALENYLTRQFASVDPVALSILTFFDDWRSVDDLVRAMPEFSATSVRRAAGTLVRSTFLLRAGSQEAKQDEQLARTWTTWLPQAGFHFATKDTPFFGPAEWPRVAKELIKESPPPFFKRYPARTRRRLPAPRPAQDAFTRALFARKTNREFSGKAVRLDAISTLLYYTWGVTGQVLTPTFGPLPRKTSPSGGARHPGEVYLVALDVDGLAPGIYYYNGHRHHLHLLRRGPLRRQLLDYSIGQTHVGKAAAVFLMTAYFPRSMWKYKSPRAYRVVTLDAGHLAQTFCLVAAWLGLAPFTTAAFRDTAIENALGIDGISESALYLVGVGMPPTGGVSAASPAAAGHRPPARRLRPTRR
jgi:SagB-type dehydrogenase family enzyme